MTLVPTDLAAFAAGVEPATIRQWAHRGKLHRYGTERQPLWSLDEITDATTRRPARLANALDKCHAKRVTTGRVPESSVK